MGDHILQWLQLQVGIDVIALHPPPYTVAQFKEACKSLSLSKVVKFKLFAGWLPPVN